MSGAAAADQRADQQARAEFGRFEDRLQITRLSGLVTNDLEARLRAVPPHSAVFFTLVSQDGRGEVPNDGVPRARGIGCERPHAQLGGYFH